MTAFMLDTDISSYIIKRRPATLVEKFERHADTLCVSVMTAAELRFAAVKADRSGDVVHGDPTHGFKSTTVNVPNSMRA
jgi:predicted nucleic acid-binding protein